VASRVDLRRAATAYTTTPCPLNPKKNVLSPPHCRRAQRPRRRWLGSLIAVVALIALGGLAWLPDPS
jgi:hypothetical protein